MPDALTILLIFVVVGVFALSLNRFLNRKPIREVASARQRLMAQAQTFPDGDLERFLSTCDLPPQEQDAARSILRFLARLLNVAVGKVAQPVSMKQLFSVEGDDARHEVQPFASELMEGFTSITDKHLWNHRWSAMKDPPRNEDETIAFIMSMSVPDLIRFFAPLIKKD